MNEEIRGAYQAWNVIDAALQSEADRAILRRCRSPREVFESLENINNQMYEKGIGRIPKTVLHARFVRALPNEYSLAKETLQSMKNRDRDEIIRMISTRYSNLPQKKGAQRSSR